MEDFPLVDALAKKYRLKTSRDDCGELTIPGRHGHIYEFSVARGLLGVIFIPAHSRPQAWTNRKRWAASGGLATVQNGECEGCLTFDPENSHQVRVAMRIAGIHAKRRQSESQRLAAMRNFRRIRG